MSKLNELIPFIVYSSIGISLFLIWITRSFIIDLKDDFNRFKEQNKHDLQTLERKFDASKDYQRKHNEHYDKLIERAYKKDAKKYMKTYGFDDYCFNYPTFVFFNIVDNSDGHHKYRGSTYESDNKYVNINELTKELKTIEQITKTCCKKGENNE